ncbi:MAG: response regulator transcription factor [Eubacteriales bacterium]
MKTILIVEDDPTLREGLCRSLNSDTLASLPAASIADARAALASVPIDLVLLDCNLPDGNGIDFCTELRHTSSLPNLPIVFLTVRDSELDEVAAFRAGACDFVRKPFSLMVLRERIQAALARTASGSDVYSDGTFTFDFAAMTFCVRETNVSLSTTEQKLLRALVENRNRIVSRTALIERMWSCDSDFIDENALSVTVRRLRGKLGADCIQTAYGLGYMWTGAKGIKGGGV